MFGYIYKIENKITGQVYIGQTTSKIPNNRFSQHKNDIKRQAHHNQYFQRSVRKYGYSSFEFTVIDKANSRKS